MLSGRVFSLDSELGYEISQTAHLKDSFGGSKFILRVVLGVQSLKFYMEEYIGIENLSQNESHFSPA